MYSPTDLGILTFDMMTLFSNAMSNVISVIRIYYRYHTITSNPNYYHLFTMYFGC